MSGNVAASVKARLLNQAKVLEEEFELFLVRYACERFLYRLGASDLRDRFVLKGAALLSVWIDSPYRATRDIDLLAFGVRDEMGIRKAMETICRVPCAEDGLSFALDTLEISRLRIEDKYPGYRALLLALLGKARIRLQVDFGVGDSIVPSPIDAVYPTLLDSVPAPELRVYPRVVTIAEKFHAMVRHGRKNSRMKDFHDVWALSEEFDFDGIVLSEAISKCFERKGIEIRTESPDALEPAFYSLDRLNTRWQHYLRAGTTRAPVPTDFVVIGERVQSFLRPVWESLAADQVFPRHWPQGGPWQRAVSSRDTSDG